MGDLIGPNPTNVGGPKSEKSNGRKYENFWDRQTDRLTDRRSWLHRTRRPASSRAGPKILLIANTDISLFSRKGYFYRSDSKTTIKVIGKLNDWTMTSNWKLHAKRLFELEHGVLYIKNSMARDQALLSLFDRTVSPIRELWHRLRPEDQKGPGTLLNYPREKKVIHFKQPSHPFRSEEHGNTGEFSEVPVRWQAFKQWSPEAEFSGIIRVWSIVEK